MTTEKIQDIYPLSPMQAGILFETLYAPETGAYLDQHVYRIGSSLQVEPFEKAWQHVCDRHAILRTSFHWEKLDEPLQIVHTDAEIPIERLDWSAVPEKNLAASISDFLKEDRKKGVDLNQAPLMRLTLIATSQKDWIVVWSCHHLLLDRWSVPIVLSDLRTTYDALCEGRRLNLPRVRQYGEYIGWLQDQDAQKAEAYWKERLSGLSSPTALPMDRSAGSLAGGDMPAREAVQVEEELTTALQNMARANRLTINTLVQGTWALLLSRYSGSEDVLFGATVSGRPASLAGVESIVGLFINSLPVRVRVPENEPLVPWLLKLQDEMAETREYEYSSAVQIQGASDIPRGVPLFESLVVVQNIRVSHSAQPGKPAGLEMQPYGGEFWRGSSLNFMATPGRELRLTISYDTARYDPADIARMLGHVRTVLAAMVENSDCTVGSLPMLTEAELKEQLADFNDTRAAYPDQKCVHQLIEEQAERAPDAVAIQFGDQTLTYGELDKRANQLAHYLKTLGVGPDMLVGLCVRRSVEMVVGLLGILKAGGAYLPLDPSYPMERLAFMISDAQVPLLVTQESCVDVLPSYWAQVICLDTEWDSIAAESAEKPACNAHPDNLAYMIYTSGSTGQPKGVMVPHRGAVNYLTWATKNYNVAEGAGTLVDTPIGFDLTVTSLLSPLTVGQKAVLIPEDQGVEGLAEAINHTQDVTLVKTTPAHMEILRGLVRREQADVVKLFVIGGEALRKETLSFWQTHAPATRHVNEYGPTETVVGCCIYEAGKEDALGNSVPIGRPIANARLYLLDAHLRPVPKGVLGELFIGGTGVVRGYINRPEVTAECFIPDSLSGIAGARLYKTGDLCRFLPDGNLEYLGRADHQVKVRGYRIELGEIESVLLQHASVRDAVVLAREDQPGDKRLVAYVIATESESNVTAIREHLRGKLPEYMVPTAFVFLDSLPLSSNGKVDRKALPIPGVVDSGQDAYVAPRTPTEEMLTGIWRDILRVERVGANDNFFELGGHSLLAMQVISRVREALEVELPLRDLFEAPVLSDLAVRIEGLRGDGESGALSIVRVSRGEPLPLSFAQQRLWFLYHLEPTSTMYNVASGLRVKGLLNVPALEYSLTEIVRRHEPLRTVVQSTDAEAVQVIKEVEGPVLSWVDLRLIPEEDREAQACKLQAEEAQTPFDLTNGPLFRAKLIQLGDEEHILLMTMHHIVSDGWSYAIIIREMGELYNGYCANLPVELPELPIQYADFAVWQKEWLSGENLERQIAHWREHLGGAPALLTLPTDRPRPSVQSFRGARKGISLSKELTHALRDFGQEEGATLFMTMLAAYNVLLSRYSGQEDVVIGSATAGRTRSELEGLVGYFLNTVALRTVLSGDPTFRELLGRVKETALGAFTHQDLPFEKLVEELQPERSLSHAPIFQATFQLQNLRRTAFNFEGLRAESLLAEGVTAKYDLGMTVSDSPDRLQVFVEYNTDLFDSWRIDSLLAHYQTLLEGIVADPDEKIARLPLLTQTEKQRVLEEWNGAKADFPRDRCIHELFESWVEKTPDATALVFQGEEVTYNELNARANQLAHYLQMMGVGPEMIVGLCVERSIEMVVGLLGILKAGAGYLPLDTSYPIDRLSFMMQDAQVPVVVAMEASANQLPTHWAQVVCLDADADIIAAQGEDSPRSGVTAVNLAYVIYTSGSTGQPKGVLVPHRGASNLTGVLREQFAIDPNSRVLQFASMSFDASVADFLMSLTSGAALHIASKDDIADISRLRIVLQSQKITTATLPPSYLALLPEDGLADLRTLCSAGEACPPEIASRWSRRLRFLNGYGPTETTVAASYYTCASIPPDASSVPIGKPITNAEVYILDNALQPVPVGVAGEIYVGGAGVTRGYLGRPDMTAERFIPNPFSTSSGQRLYRTGDRARFLVDGNIEFVNRVDGQAKVRGFRIELGEIESALERHPGVVQAAASVHTDENGRTSLVGYVVPSQERQIEIWPSVAEYFIYDEVLYYAMTNDLRRNASYLAAMERDVKGKTVVEIGPGQDAILTRMCVEAGAKHVYAIELLERSYNKAKETIARHGLEDKITLIHGDATKVELPEKVDACVSEIVGAIGGSEGASLIINNAWRFLKPDGAMIPQRSLTKIAAVSVPDWIKDSPKFTPSTARYVEQIFDQVGYKFDLRICLRGMAYEDLISNADAFEDLDFTQPTEAEHTHNIELKITRAARLDGFLVWLNLMTIDTELIDALAHEHCWLPVYLPAFPEGVDVVPGDIIRGTVARTLCENGLNPDYTVSGQLQTQSGESRDFVFDAWHFRDVYKHTPFYQRLFDNDQIPIASSEGRKPSSKELRDHLGHLLPDYMIPSSFVVLESMPLSPNGKVDRAALPAPEAARPELESAYALPSNDVERALAAIWQEVLRLDQVGIHDNFFELGGDSILSIQLVSRAQREGISITPKQIFEHQTVAQLASVAGTEDVVVAEQGRVSGSVPLTPIQKLFFELFQTDPHHYNNSQLLSLQKRYESGVLQQAIARLIDHHDALRLRFQKTKSGWTQTNAAHEDNEFFEWIDLSQLSEQEQTKRVGVEADRLQASLNLEEGPIVRAAYFDLGDRAPGLLLFIVHHLAVDGVSWRVLLEDLESLLRQSEDKAAELPLKTTSFQEWAVRIEEHAGSSELATEVDYWLSAQKSRAEDLPVDNPAGRNDNQSLARHLVRLDAEDTTALLQEVPAIYHTQINDVLLTALAQTISRWTNRDAVLIEMEGHGREELFADVDISRTVGWFTSVYPVSLQVRPDEEVGAALKSVKEQLRRIPNRGIGYGILRYGEYSPVREKLAAMREPQIVFNYLGQFGGTYSEDGLFSRARGSQGARQSAKQERQFLLEINSSVASDKLEVQWNYSRELFESVTIERLGEEFIEAIRAIVAHCRTSDAGGYTPSDLSKVKINQKALDKIVGKLRKS